MAIVGAYLIPGLPQLASPAAAASEGVARLRAATDQIHARAKAARADVVIVYSDLGPNPFGTAIQLAPRLSGTFVDADTHALGAVAYAIENDLDFTYAVVTAARTRGLVLRELKSPGFPLDAGSVAAANLAERLSVPCVLLSSHAHARGEDAHALATAIHDALRVCPRRALALAVTSLSNRPLGPRSEPARIHSAKDEQWNIKILEFLRAGRWQDVLPLARQFQSEARVADGTTFTSPAWLAGLIGGTGDVGEVLAYTAVHGIGAAVVEFVEVGHE